MQMQEPPTAHALVRAWWERALQAACGRGSRAQGCRAGRPAGCLLPRSERAHRPRVLGAAVQSHVPILKLCLHTGLCPSPTLRPLVLGLSAALPLQEGPGTRRADTVSSEHAASSGCFLHSAAYMQSSSVSFYGLIAHFFLSLLCLFYIELKYKQQMFTEQSAPSVQ